MSYELSYKLVVGVASSALFDLKESDAVFRARGEDDYRAYQEDQRRHLEPAADTVPSVHVPFGIVNQKASASDSARAREQMEPLSPEPI